MTDDAMDPGDALTEAEQALVDMIRRGEVADLKRRTVRGSVLRELIMETRPDWTVPPAGIRLNRVVVAGGLDLEGCILNKPLLFWHSRIESGGDRGALLIRDSRLKRLGIHSCTIDGNVVADRCEVESGMFLGGGLVRGVLQIRGGKVVGALTIDGTEIGDGTSAVLAAGVRISGPLIMRRARVKGEIALPRAVLDSGIYGEEVEITKEGLAFSLEGARIGGDLLLDRARITGAIRLSNTRIDGQLSADAIAVTSTPDAVLAGGLSVRQGVKLSDAKIGGAVWLDGAEIGKMLRANNIDIEGGETAFGADMIRVGGNWEMARGRFVGQIRCPGADVTGQWRMTEANVFGSDLAIRADGARIRGGIFMSRVKIVGLVRLPAAEIGNQLRLSAASIKVDEGPALLASSAGFGRDVELNDGFQTAGAIVLDQARIEGTCDLAGSHLKSALAARGPAPTASASRPGKAGDAVRDELVLSLVDAHVGRLQMPERADERPHGVVDLTRASVGSFVDSAAAWPPPRGSIAGGDKRETDHLVLDGFTYEHLDNPSGEAADASRSGVAKRRIIWLEGQSDRDLVEHFKPQAWLQLAERLSAQGYEEDARAIAIARQRRERKSRSMRMSSRWQNRLLDWLALYGHNPWRTVGWMIATVLIFAGVHHAGARLCSTPGCFDESAYVVSHRDGYSPDAFRRVYPAFNPLAYSLDVFVPVVNLGYKDHWRPNIEFGPLASVPIPSIAEFLTGPETFSPKPFTITIGGVLYALVLLEMLLGVLLTSLAVTGFTGMLRRGD